MSFFVSDALKGRVTEEEVAKDTKFEYIDEDLQRQNLTVFIRTEDKTEHEFEFVRLSKEKNKIEIVFEIPHTYRFLPEIFKTFIYIKISNDFGSLFDTVTKIENFDLVKQNERNCYLLKIVIDTQLKEIK